MPASGATVALGSIQWSLTGNKRVCVGDALVTFLYAGNETLKPRASVKLACGSWMDFARERDSEREARKQA